MNLKRASLIALAAVVIPSVAAAQITQRIYVEKNFTDGNDAEVKVSYECNDGLPSSGMAMITGGGIGHTFVIEELTGDNPVECVVYEEDAVAMGYIPEYDMFADGFATSDEACTYIWPGNGPAPTPPDDDTDGVDYVLFSTSGQASCIITNSPAPVLVVVTKEWDLTGTQEAFEDTNARIVVETEAYMERYNSKGNWVEANCESDDGPCRHTLNFVGENPPSQSVRVYPDDFDNGNYVYLDEKGVDSYVDASDNCGGAVLVRANQGGSCTFTNAVFYEGIPTLSQYGLALLALLMLGVGFVGFRRFV